MDTGQHELQKVHAMCPWAPATAIRCTKAADEPSLHAG